MDDSALSELGGFGNAMKDSIKDTLNKSIDNAQIQIVEDVKKQID